MEELRIICEIVTSTPSDTDWVLKILKNQEVLVKRFDAGSGRERFILYEKVQQNNSFL